MTTIDASEVERFGRDLIISTLVVSVGARAVIQKGALNIKNDARQRVSGVPHASMYPNSIRYETKLGGGTLEAEIGPEVGGPQWGLGDLLEFGTAKTNVTPVPHLMPAAEKELPSIERFLGELAERSIP